MSAYVVPETHVAAILRVGLEGPEGRPVNPGNAWHGLTWFASDPRPVVAAATDSNDYFVRLATVRRSLDHETVQRVGAMLMEANVESVAYRYPDDARDDLPGPRPAYWTDHETFDVRRARRLTAVEALKALDGFEYQSCERPDWQGSEAERFCDALRSALINALPGYDDADTWEIDR